MRALAAPAATYKPTVADPVVYQADPGDRDEVLEVLAPCPTCGSLDLWQTIAGNWRCQHCEAAALRRSRSLADKAARLRERYLRQRRAAERQSGRCTRLRRHPRGFNVVKYQANVACKGLQAVAKESGELTNNQGIGIIGSMAKEPERLTDQLRSAIQTSDKSMGADCAGERHRHCHNIPIHPR